MLNDTSEMSFGVERVQNVGSRWSAPPGSDPAATEILQTALRNLESSMTENAPFVLSASTSPFLLNQWANYGDSSGCAIGLKALSLLNNAVQGATSPRQVLPLWLEVLYDADEQDAYITSVLDQLAAQGRLISQAIQHAHEPASLLEQNLSMLVATLKHSAFLAESEVRVVVVKQESTSIHYRPTARGILPAAQQRVSLAHLRIRNAELGARDLCRQQPPSICRTTASGRALMHGAVARANDARIGIRAAVLAARRDGPGNRHCDWNG